MYCARFCAIEGVDGKFQRTFATCAGTRADVWECEKSGDVVLLASFETRDANEAFYACEWCAIDSTGRRESGDDATTTGKGRLRPCLALAGEGAVVRVVDCVTGRLHVNLVGHGGTVNSVVSHPSRPSVVATASKDLSVRLWHVNTGVTMAILAGARGHRNELLSVDFHPTIDAEGKMKLVTGAMDNCVKVWATPPLADSMAEGGDLEETTREFQNDRHRYADVFEQQRARRLRRLRRVVGRRGVEQERGRHREALGARRTRGRGARAREPISFGVGVRAKRREFVVDTLRRLGIAKRLRFGQY